MKKAPANEEEARKLVMGRQDKKKNLLLKHLVKTVKQLEVNTATNVGSSGGETNTLKIYIQKKIHEIADKSIREHYQREFINKIKGKSNV